MKVNVEKTVHLELNHEELSKFFELLHFCSQDPIKYPEYEKWAAEFRDEITKEL